MVLIVRTILLNICVLKVVMVDHKNVLMPHIHDVVKDFGHLNDVVVI